VSQDADRGLGVGTLEVPRRVEYGGGDAVCDVDDRGGGSSCGGEVRPDTRKGLGGEPQRVVRDLVRDPVDEPVGRSFRALDVTRTDGLGRDRGIVARGIERLCEIPGRPTDVHGRGRGSDEEEGAGDQNESTAPSHDSTRRRRRETRTAPATTAAVPPTAAATGHWPPVCGKPPETPPDATPTGVAQSSEYPG